MGRAQIRTKFSRPAGAGSDSTTNTLPSSKFSRKKSLLLSKRAAFVSRIEKSSPASSARSRRRARAAARENLATSLDSLADALPSVNTNSQIQTEAERKRKQAAQSIKSRPGAMKRKDKLVKAECERFSKNLAILENSGAAAVEGGGKARDNGGMNRWAMLRNFIDGTLERKEDFLRGKGAESEMETES